MKARPILFSGPMVRALLEGRKTQTRRIIKAPTTTGEFVLSFEHGVPEYNFGPDDRKANGLLQWHRCPYGKSGDLLWVRETWVSRGTYHGNDKSYITTTENEVVDSATGVEYREEWLGMDDDIKWEPSIFMPHWASRITLRVEEVRVERLQDIGQGDACAEGAPAPHEPIGWYSELWDSINGAGAWDKNPWVWVVAFDVIKANFRQVLEAAA